MKDLRERCAKIIMSWELNFGKQLNQKRKVNDLEAFAREIQAEALEEAKEAVSKPVPGVTSEHAVTLMHACERITALAASGSEKK